jgi:hypothetical protein
MARSFKSTLIVAGCLIAATFTSALSPATSLANPPKAAKPSFSKPSFSKPSFSKPSYSKPSAAKPSYKSSVKPFVKPKFVFVAHHHGHLHLIPVVYPVAIANSIHTLYFIDDNGATQVYGQYEVTTNGFGATDWGGLIEAQTTLTNAGYQCWIDDMQPNTNG